eukprot:365436-Chlamydomonas_euryale.AAC.11
MGIPQSRSPPPGLLGERAEVMEREREVRNVSWVGRLGAAEAASKCRGWWWGTLMGGKASTTRPARTMKKQIEHGQSRTGTQQEDNEHSYTSSTTQKQH